MEEYISSSESAASPTLSTHELLILHTSEAQDWAMYMWQILKCSKKFHKERILLYSISPADQLHNYNFEYLRSFKCIVLLLTGAFLDILNDVELQGALQRLLYPRHRVVVLFCGVSESDTLTDIFHDWPRWRKLYAEDEPAVYVTTILESIAHSTGVEAKQELLLAAAEKLQITEGSLTENPTADETEEEVPHNQKQKISGDDEHVASSSTATCLTVQPKRVQCGEEESIFIIFTDKVDSQIIPVVEFSAENCASRRVPGIVENEYTICVRAPDMPPGEVSLTMYTDQLCICLKPVIFYTMMGEVSWCLENATDPISFICQAFNSTSTEFVDNILTDSLKSKMPSTGLELFGIRQIEEGNMAAYERKNELPTLLHFSAKYGLRKLTTILLQSPGALQAYSVMNKDGDYPNTLAEKSGFPDLRKFMDDFVETADFEDSINAEVYERMAAMDISMKFSSCSEDIYESMVGINPECADELYVMMNAVEENPEEALLRKFFQAKPYNSEILDNKEQASNKQRENDDHTDPGQSDQEDDPYTLFFEDVYDSVDTNIKSPVISRPPAPIPRPEVDHESLKLPTYISKVSSQDQPVETGYATAQSVKALNMQGHDPFAGMKTPGQKQLISLQERVKFGKITVDEAVQEFKAWRADHDKRARSIRYQQENLRRLRESITRRHKDREKSGKQLEYEISAPLQRNVYWGTNSGFDCAIYDPAPRKVAQTTSANPPIQRGSWKTGSTSSTSSTESNRLSTHSNISYSSGTEPDSEDVLENMPPPLPPRHSDTASPSHPPRVPPRIPHSVSQKMLNERYIFHSSPAIPQIPPRQHTDLTPLPRRHR